MKSVTLKNKLNGEKVICDNVRDCDVIDGVEYLVVRRIGTDRRFLMRKDILEKVIEKKAKA